MIQPKAMGIQIESIKLVVAKTDGKYNIPLNLNPKKKQEQRSWRAMFEKIFDWSDLNWLYSSLCDLSRKDNQGVMCWENTTAPMFIPVGSTFAMTPLFPLLQSFRLYAFNDKRMTERVIDYTNCDNCNNCSIVLTNQSITSIGIKNQGKCHKVWTAVCGVVIFFCPLKLYQVLTYTSISLYY